MNRIASFNPETGPPEHKSLGFGALLGLLQNDRKISILDLGQGLGTNIDFWSQFPCRISIADFYRGYQAKLAAEPEMPRSMAMAEALPYDGQTSFDVVLSWDLFNYFDLEELEMLVKLLCRWCRPGTLIFGLISFQPQIPNQPVVYKILDNERILYQMNTPEMRPCPRHQPRDVARLMAQFRVAGSFLLRHGIQEYVWAYK